MIYVGQGDLAKKFNLDFFQTNGRFSILISIF